MRAQVFIKIGTHAEKDYLSKMIGHFDGYLIGANLLEATPGASASLVLKFSGSKRKFPYMIDPMTYVFGTYIDRETDELRDDLDRKSTRLNSSHLVISYAVF